MTDESISAATDPLEVLTAVRRLTRQVRRAQRGTWFPLLVFAAITLISIPLYRYAPRHVGPCRTALKGTEVCTAYAPSVWVYWPIALVVAYVVIALFYLRQSRRRGVGTGIRVYVIVGIVLAALMAAAWLWRASQPAAPFVDALPRHEYLYGLVAPAPAIGLALLVLAWVERRWALLAYGVAYLLIVLVQSNQVVHSHSPWGFLPTLLVPAGILLLGSAGFALIRPNAGANPR